MGWKDAIDYLRGASRGSTGAEPRQDEGLPLGARIGSLVSLQLSPMLRASSAGSLIVLPEEADTRILAISQLKLTMQGRVYRYYLATGDNDGEEKFLQIYADAQGELKEILYCTQLVRITPETVQDQDAYTGASAHGLGDRNYTLWRGQLDDIGIEASAIETAFAAEEAIDYRRDAGDEEADFVQPYTGTETRLDDAAGVLGLKQQLYYMPYRRVLRDGGQEYLLITTEVLQSVNGDARKRGIHVDFVIGIPVEQERLVIQ
jgi:hypothetical protein